MGGVIRSHKQPIESLHVAEREYESLCGYIFMIEFNTLRDVSKYGK